MLFFTPSRSPAAQISEVILEKKARSAGGMGAIGVLAMFLFLLLGLAGCDSAPDYEAGADQFGHTAPTPATLAANRLVAQSLSDSDQQDFEDARRGLIASDDQLLVEGKDGTRVWDMPSYDFIQGAAPDSVNPSLWRQAMLNNIHGVFEVTPGIYQVRGFDLANMSLIRGQRGWIIVDPLTSAETAGKAFEFAMQHLGDMPVRAVLFTHSHIDHFGGIEGLLSNMDEGEKSNLRIIAPHDFLEEATSENLIAGTAMGRRAMYMYGKRLARTERGHIDSGLGKGPAFGTFGIAAPTELISKTPTEMLIDGIPFVFQAAPGSEAPAEYTFYLPQHRAFCGAEVVSRTMHNLYTLRGAKVRDALAWSGYIDQAMQMLSEAEVYFGSHHWPLWGRQKVQDFLAGQRDLYKYIHDQSVRLMNAGHTPNEIADLIRLPENLQKNFDMRGYYGTLKHNAKAVYQSYLGWFTGNPAALDPLPEAETARRTVAMMGGGANVLTEATRLFEKAAFAEPDQVNREYRWTAQLLNHLVFAEPDNTAAKALLAKTYDQLGYQAESGPWRDFYLTGAYELRNGPPEEGVNPAIMKEVLLKTPVSKLFESMAVNLNGPEAEGKRLSIEVAFTDLQQRYLLSMQNAVLRHRPLAEAEHVESDARLQLTQALFIDILVGDAGLTQMLLGDDLRVEGSQLDLLSFFAAFDTQQGTFNIVTP